MKKSIIYFRPDFHCSFFYRDGFRKLGWKADIFVPYDYPEKLLYSDKDIIREFKIHKSGFFYYYLNAILLIIWYLSIFWKYKYHVYYGRPKLLFFEDKFGLTWLFGKSFNLRLSIAKLFGVKLIYMPTGCHDQEPKARFSLFDDGNVCGNCGFFEKCSDELNNRNFEVIRRYFDFGIGWDPLNSSQYKTIQFKYKNIDLDQWNPNIKIPEEFFVDKSEKIKILHSFFPAGRLDNGRNIKGSGFILDAVERLKNEGYPVEYYYIQDKPSNQMRYYQAQADIVVEQLIYGWWGSTGVEAMALGKPIVCYLRPEWKKFFLETFPEYNDLPVINATTNDIYDVLKKLIIDKDFRKQSGENSRKFAERHFNPIENTKEFEKILLGL